MEIKRSAVCSVNLIFFLVLLASFLAGCGSSSDDSATPLVIPQVNLNGAELASSKELTGLERVSDEDWDETAVRKVLHLFAFGSHASDEQIQAWAEQPPHHAIEEILYVGEFHPKLSPVQLAGATGEQGTLKGLSDFWSSNHPENRIHKDSRNSFSLDTWRSPERIWVRAAHTPGLNPVRQKIGLYLTNYHLAVNENAGVNRHQMVAYYDDLMNAVAADRPFEEVLTIAAAHAATAVQYNHRENTLKEGIFRGNEDFAREYFQLFFGILTSQDGDDDYHENTTIPNMARLLTEMYPEERTGAASSRMIYEQAKNATAPKVIHQDIYGNNALERLKNLAPHAIEHPDSLSNLPIMIVRWLADDTLADYPERQQRIRDYWASLETKNLMTFLKGYTTSTDFHTPERVKYYSTFDRSLILTNRMVTDVMDAVHNHYDPQGSINSSGFEVFRPHHDVFGAQTGEDAYASSEYFMRTFNRFTWDNWRLSRSEHQDTRWKKDWSHLLPEPAESQFCVTAEAVSEWLWQRFVADGLKYFGPLERIQVYTLINTGKDAAATLKESVGSGVFYDSHFSEEELTEGGSLNQLFSDQANNCVFTNTEDQRRGLASNLGQAVNFIANTPFMFFQEGR